MRIQIKGETLNEAINNAMIELSTTSDNLEYEIIQKEASGFLGIGAKPCIIEAYKKDDKEEKYKRESINKEEKLVENTNGVYEFMSNSDNTKKGYRNYSFEKMTRDPEETFKEIKKFLDPIFKEFNTDINMTYEAKVDTNTLVINLIGEKMGVLIGKHGQTLDSIQHLVNIVINNGHKDKIRVRIDSENYRDKRNKTLESLAKSVAIKVRKTHKDYELEPMSSFERRIIHSVLQKERNIETVSVGEDKQRHVIVKYRR